MQVTLFDGQIYDDPAAYSWADSRVESKLWQLLGSVDNLRNLPWAAERLGPPSPDPDHHDIVAIDGTGTKIKRRLQRVKAARDAGFWVRLLYVALCVGRSTRLLAASS